LAASSIVFCSCCSRSRSISSTRSSYLRQKPPNHCMMIERFSFWRIHIYLHFNTDRHARLEPELQVVIMETIFLLLTRKTLFFCSQEHTPTLKVLWYDTRGC
jgi:hypothetical protein